MNAQRQGVVPANSSFTPAPSGLLQRKCACGNHTMAGGECAQCSKGRHTIQRATRNSDLGTRNSGGVPPIVHEVLQSPGQPLDAATRTFMEPRFGHDFSWVRVHTDAKAAESTRAVKALAYTVGNNIVFGGGQYAPGGTSRSRLLAHELTHVLQQEAADLSSVQTKLAVDQLGNPLERETDFMADIMTRPSPSRPDRFAGGTLPYRQATELADCIRIMGDENTEYCREVVLGEKPRSTCDPTAVQNPLSDISTFQSPGASGWWGAKFGCYRNSCSRKHKGWDIFASSGTPIVAAVTGSVTQRQDPGGFGDYIRLTSSEDPTRVYLYGHLSAREPAGSYCVGRTIGQTGTSGNASADRPHLHFQVHLSGTPVDPVSHFTEPTMVVEATGSSATVIDKTLPAPCTACAM